MAGAESPVGPMEYGQSPPGLGAWGQQAENYRQELATLDADTGNVSLQVMQIQALSPLRVPGLLLGWVRHVS